jgi:hypothetical protein
MTEAVCRNRLRCVIDEVGIFWVPKTKTRTQRDVSFKTSNCATMCSSELIMIVKGLRRQAMPVSSLVRFHSNAEFDDETLIAGSWTNNEPYPHW